MVLLRIFIVAVTIFQFNPVTANNLPEILISGNDSVYPGETANFTCHVDTVGIDLVTFQWVRTDGENVTYFNETVDMEISGGDSSTIGGPDYFFNSTFNVINVNYTDNEVGYYCNASGCNVSMTAYLTVLSPMIMSFTASQLLLNVTDSLSLVCDALGGPRLVITIRRDGTTVATGTMGDDRVVHNITAGDDTFGTYTCIATINDMQQISESMLVVVAPYDLMITADFNGDISARPAVVEYGDALTLNCTASGGPNNLFRWFKDGVLLQENDNVLQISTVSAADGGLYECVVNNTAGNSIINITIYVPPRFLTVPQDVEAFIGTAVNLSCSAEGFPAPDITWTYQAMPFTNETLNNTNSTYAESTIVITNLLLSHGGSYSCQINNDAATMPSSSSAAVAVIGETVMGLMNASAFPGQSASWDCQVQSTIPLQFMWYLNNELVLNTTGSHMDDTASSSYTLANVSYSNYGSNVTCSAAGSSLVVNSTAVYLTVLRPNITDITITPSPSDNNLLLHQFNDAVSLTCTAEGGPRIMTRWQFDNGSSVADGSNSVTYNVTSLSTTHTGVYYCEAIIDGMTDTSMNYTLYVAPYNVTIMGDNLYNRGEQLQLNCSSEGGPVLEYAWLLSGNTIPNANTSTLTIDNVNTTHAGDYTCNVTNNAGYQNYTVTVYVAPYNVIIMGDNLYNRGEQLQLNCSSVGGPVLEYTWLFSGDIIPNANTSTLIIDNVNTTNGGNYTCNVTNNAGDQSNTVTVYIAPYEVTVTGNTLYSQGNQLMLDCTSQGGPQLEYSWTFLGDMIYNNSMLIINNVNTTHGGNYTCNVTNAAGSNDTTVTVYIAPYDVEINGVRRYSYGSDIELNCTSEGGPQLEFTWIFSNNTIDNDTILNISNATVTNGGDYTCNVTNDAGFSSNTTTVYIGPRFITDPEANQEVVINGEFSLTCSAEGFPRPSIIWFMNNTMISSGVSDVNTSMTITSTLTISNANFNDSGMYYCQAESSEFTNLNVTSGVGIITVVERPVVSPEEHNVTLGTNITFDCNEFGSPPFTYQWYMRNAVTGEDILLVNETGEFYNIESTMYNETGGYFCEATNSLGVLSNSTAAQLLVRPSIVEHPVMQVAYPGVMVNFSCRAEGFSLLNYSWFMVPRGADTGMEIENETDTTYIITDPMYDDNATGYYCIATNNEGIAISNTSMLTVLRPNITDITITPSPSDNNLLLRQFNDAVSLTCTAEGGPRIMTRWQFDNGSSVADGSNNVTYNVTSLSTADTGVYYCEAIIDGMTDTSMNYTLYVAPYDVTITGDNLYSQGEQLQLNCSSEGGPVLEYTWLLSGNTIPNANNSTLTIDNVNATHAGDYTCNVTNNAGYQNYTVTVYIAPYNVIITGETLYIEGERLQLNCSSEGGPVLEYTWLFSGNIIPNANTSTLTIDNVNTTHAGDYTCNVTNDAGTDSDTVTVYIAPYDVTIMGDNLYNQGQQLQLNCSSEGGPVLNYTWTFSGDTIPNANTDTLIINNVNTTHAGDYTCNVTNNAGTDSYTITVYIAPYNVTIMGDNLYNRGQQLQLNCSSEGGPVLAYTWLFLGNTIPNANTSTLTINDVTTANGGNYTCNVTNNAGTDNYTIAVYIAPYDVSITGDNLYARGEELQLNCSSEGGPVLEYTWLFSGDTIPNANTDILTIDNVNTTHAGDYTCNVTNNAGYDNQTITVYIAPYEVTVTGNTLYSQGNQLMLNCTSQGGPQLEYSWTFLGDIISNSFMLIIDDVNTTHAGNYTCNVNNPAGSNDTTVTVYIAPYDVEINGVRRYPYGSDIELNCTSEGGPQLEFTWIFSNSTIDNDAMLNISSATVTNGGDYTCNVTNNAGFSSNTTTVYISPRFITDPEANQEVVINGEFSLTCSAEGFPRPSIIWFMNNTMISSGVSDVNTSMTITSTLTISNATFNDSGMYYCQAKSSEFTDLNVTSGVGNVTVVERPVVAPQEHNVTLGTNITFDCNEFGSPPFAYQWYMRNAVTGEDILLVNETDEFYNIESTMYNDTGGYFCGATNSLGVLSNSTAAQLLVRPSIVEHPVMQVAYPGVMVNFSCRAEGFSSLDYSWFIVAPGANTGMEIENETDTTYIITDPVYDDNATGYYCITTNNEGIAVSNTSMLTVLRPNITGITITPSPSDNNLLLHDFNDAVSLTCTAEGGPRIMTRWQFDNGSSVETVADGSNNVTYTVPSLSTADTGVYYCEAIIDGMNDTSMNYTLYVAPYDVNATGNNMYPQGYELMLSCLSEGGPELEYSWIFSNMEIANTSNLIINNVNASNGGEYTCNVTNEAGSESDTITVYIGVVITTHPQDELVNVSDSVNFTCEASGSSPISYRWLYNGNYIMEDPGHIEGVNTTTLMIVDVIVTDWGVYSCEASNIVDDVTSNGATLHVSPLGTVDVTPNGIAVDHMTDNVTFTCQSMAGPNLNYTWLINGSSEALNNSNIVVNDSQLIVNNVTYLLGGRYICVVTNLAGEGTNSSDLFVNPFIVTDPQSQLTVNDSGVNFTCTAIAFPSPYYNWTTPIPNSDFNTSTITIVVDYSFYGNYTCFAESNGTVAPSQPALLTVSPQGSVEISPVDIATTVNSTVNINCSAEGGPNNMFEWSKQGTGVVSNDAVLEFPMITGTDGAVYECTVYNAAGNETMNVTLTVAPYNATITEAVNDNVVTFTCYADGGLGNTYEWLRLRDNEVVSMTQELVLNNTDPLDGGDYRCTITNIAGNTSAMTTLNVATVIVTSPETQNVTAGQSFMLICNATGYPVPSIEWRLNETSYMIRDSSITTITLTGGLRSNTSNITVTNAVTNDTGIYECVATNVVNTDTQDANVTVQNCPDEPINVQIFNVNSRDLTINWTEPHDNNDPITHYNISYQNPDCLVNASIAAQNVTVTSTEEQVTINDLHPGEFYTFTIIAINNICPSQPSLPASMRTLEEVPGAAPVVTTSHAERSINVSWEMLECQDRHGNITMYEVRYTDLNFGENVNQTLNTSSGDELSLMVDDLEEFANYTIEVRAYTAVGPGPYSSPMDVQTLPDIPSASVTNLTVRETQPTAVYLSWGPVNDRDQNGIIQSYGIYYRLYNSSDDYRMIFNVTARSRNITGLMEDEVYVFTVTAFNQVGESTVNVSIMAQTNESVPSAPQNVMISNDTDVDDIAVLVTWDPPSDPNGIIQYYRVEFQQISDPLDNDGIGKRNAPLNDTVMNEFANITSGGTGTISTGAPTMVTLRGLVAYRDYNYSVFAATSVGEGPPADGSFLTREDVPFPPENLTVSIPGVARNSTTLLVNWERPECDRGILSGYELRYVRSSVGGDCDNNGMTVNITGADQLSYTINGLCINTNYIVEVRGRTGAGLGDPATANGTTDEDAPDPVMNIVAQFSPNNTIRGIYNVTWTPPAATNGSFYQLLQYSYTSAYTIGPAYSDFINITLNQNENQFTFESDAFYYTNYNFTIITVNIKYNISNGPAEISNQSSPTVPTAVRKIKVMMSTPESIYLTWDHPEYPNSQLLNYIVYYNDNPEKLQLPGNISTVGFENETVGIVTSYNLTGLVPFTNYTILVTVSGRDVDDAPFDMEILQRTNATVPTEQPTIPSTITPLPPADTDTITVVLPSPEQIETGIVETYAVIVVTGNLLRVNDNSRRRRQNEPTPRDIINDRGGELPPPYNRTHPTDIYTAAVFNRAEDVPAMFIVGNGSRTVGPDGTVYENAPLAEGTEYGVFTYIRLESDNAGPGPLLVDDSFLRVVTTGVTPEDDNNAGAIAAGVIIPLIIIAIIIVVVIVLIWYYRRHHYTKQTFTGEVAYTESENVVLNPVAPQPYLGTFQPIPVTEFRNHVTKMHADSDYRFSEEYAAVEPEHSPTTEATLHPNNTNKNRYANISAYDHSRVRLQVISSEAGSDYINANYIDGYKRKNAYIATQGPVPDTFASFWRMIWECESQTIVMLTNLEEKGRVKCHQYWPDDKVTIPGPVKVSTHEQLELAEYTVRTFSLKRSGSKEERIVKQYHYTTWPDFGVPEHPTPVLRFTRRILASDQQDAGPIVVHCSAGVGRSGTFITLHSQLQRIMAEGTIDIFPFVRQMRYRRCHMVQTEPQYVFIHDALLESVECGETEVVARDLKGQYRKLASPSDDDPKKRLIEEEFKKIDDSIHASGDNTAGQTPANKAKNRYANILPYDTTRCRISAVPGQEGSDYINASYIDGYLKQKAYVATQGPLPDTAAEFWRMIWELKCATIVMLVKEREQGRVKCHHYWPDTGAETFGQYQVVAHSSNEYAEYTLREFKLVDKKDNSSLPVRHFQFTTWPEGGNVPENSSGLIDLIGQVQKWQQNSGNKPITVHCSGGSGRTGTYIAISILLDRLKVEGVVDVFQTVRGLRLQRMLMVQTLAQYEFCYTTVLEFLDSFELYSNFK